MIFLTINTKKEPHNNSACYQKPCFSYLIKPPWKKKKDKMYKILMTWGSILLLSLSLSLRPFEELTVYRITKSKEEQVKLDRNALSCRVIRACLWRNFFCLLPCSLLLAGKSSTVAPHPQMSGRIGERASMSVCLGLCFEETMCFSLSFSLFFYGQLLAPGIIMERI